VGTPRIDISRSIPEKTRLILAVAAGGRCEFAGCNDFLFEHHLTLRRGVFGQNAHIIAFSEDGPRASAKSGTPEVHDIANLLLLCPECHKHVAAGDEGSHFQRYRRYPGTHPAIRRRFFAQARGAGGRARSTRSLVATRPE
jgi:hypothetical protein